MASVAYISFPRFPLKRFYNSSGYRLHVCFLPFSAQAALTATAWASGALVLPAQSAWDCFIFHITHNMAPGSGVFFYCIYTISPQPGFYFSGKDVDAPASQSIGGGVVCWLLVLLAGFSPLYLWPVLASHGLGFRFQVQIQVQRW
ncbi:uncharacterized protein IWZ02DRAFT_268640 [Phyllosticta citriasiana]|uniref:Uncharacterized protein n=1 Tax=Phyllosticta citriasiana TaxID=595635 RepID=A0ABR1KSS4_9PEZI